MLILESHLRFGGLVDALIWLDPLLVELPIGMGVEDVAPPGDFPINFSIILALKVDFVGVVDPVNWSLYYEYLNS